MLREARVALDDAIGGFVEHAFVVELDRRHDEAFGPHVGGFHRHAARHGAAHVVVMAEHLAETDQPLTVEDRHGCAEIRDMADPARAVVGVVPEENIALKDVVFAEIFEHRLDQRRIGAARQLAALGIEQRHAVVVLIADHGRARGALDRRLDLQLGRAHGASDNLELDRSDFSNLSGLAHDAFLILRLP